MFGTYKVNEIEHSVSLDVIGGSYPTWDNSHQKRFITINWDELTYRNWFSRAWLVSPAFAPTIDRGP